MKLPVAVASSSSSSLTTIRRFLIEAFLTAESSESESDNTTAQIQRMTSQVEWFIKIGCLLIDHFAKETNRSRLCHSFPFRHWLISIPTPEQNEQVKSQQGWR